MRHYIALKDIIQIIKGEEFTTGEIHCHPNNVKILREIIQWVFPLEYYAPTIKEDKHLPEFIQKWEFPPTPFWIHNEEDLEWAIPLKYGKWVNTEERAFYLVDPIYRNMPNYVYYHCRPIEY